MAYKIKDKDGRPVVSKGGENILGADNHETFELKDFSDKERSFLAVASTDSPDRFKDIIEVDGWELKNYRRNPVLMAFHAYHTLPVGRSLEEFADAKGKVKRLMFRPQFAAYPDTMRMYEMYRDGFLKGFSVGFLPKKSQDIKDDKKPKDEDEHPFFHRPTRFLKQELLENSVAPIPANPEALSEIKIMVKNGSIYVPAKYLQEEQKPELETFDDYIHVKVEDEDRFTDLFEDGVAEGVIRVFGRVKNEDEDELIDHKFIFIKTKFTEEQAMDSISLYAEEAYTYDETMKLYDPEAYTVKATVLVEALPILDEKAFETKRKELDVGDDTDTDETECEFCQEELDKEYTIGEDIEFDDSEFITEEDVEEKPYPNEINEEDLREKLKDFYNKKLNFESYKDKQGAARRRAEIECPECKMVRWVDERNIVKSNKFTGVCQSCTRTRQNGKNHPGYKGGRWRQSNGYIGILASEVESKFQCMKDSRGYIYEHRYVMAKKLDRPLSELEHVHHINGIKEDNKIENLELVNNSEHLLIMKLEKRIKDLEGSEKEKIEIRPYENEHACRLLAPTGFTSYARKSCFRKSGGKCIDFIFGIKGGKSKTQAMRYKKSIWTAAAARSHCSGAGGSFEAAGKELTDMLTILEDFSGLCEKLKGLVSFELNDKTVITAVDEIIINETIEADVDDDTEEKRIGGNKNLPTDPEADWDTRAVLNRMRK